MIAVTVSVRMKVTTDAIATAAPVDNPDSSEFSLSDVQASPAKLSHLIYACAHTAT